MLAVAASMLNPRTRQATAFYAALGITLWDVYRQGFHPINASMLAAMAGIGVLGAMGAIMGRTEKEPKPPEK
jgi:hypothetical protein